MKLVAFSDTHTLHKGVNLPDGDVLVFAGDGEFRSPGDVSDFNHWLAGFGHECKIVLAGNHDFALERAHDQALECLSAATYLQDEPYMLPNGMLLWATPWTVTFMDWAFMETEEYLDQHYWSRIPEETDILLTHGPAFGHLDTARPGSKHIGSQTLARRIETLGIPYVIHGHIHGGYGRKTVGKTTYINCAVTDESYQLANPPAIIDL